MTKPPESETMNKVFQEACREGKAFFRQDTRGVEHIPLTEVLKPPESEGCTMALPWRVKYVKQSTKQDESHIIYNSKGDVCCYLLCPDLRPYNGFYAAEIVRAVNQSALFERAMDALEEMTGIVGTKIASAGWSKEVSQKYDNALRVLTALQKAAILKEHATGESEAV